LPSAVVILVLTEPSTETILESILETSELVEEISEFKLEITTANASSFSKSTALMKVTISANVSLSAVDAVRIASILPFSVRTSAEIAASTPVALVASPASAPSKESTEALIARTSASVASISACRAVSKHQRPVH
jgi:hypothetical protein